VPKCCHNIPPPEAPVPKCGHNIPLPEAPVPKCCHNIPLLEANPELLALRSPRRQARLPISESPSPLVWINPVPRGVPIGASCS